MSAPPETTSRAPDDGTCGAWIGDIERLSNLTRAQFLIWIGQKIDPRSPLYNMAFAFAIDGALDEGRFTASFAVLARETEALRTVIDEHDGVPQQKVLAAAPVGVVVQDLSAAEDPELAAREWVAARSARPLDLSVCSFDSVLLRLGEDRWIWFFNQHHIVTDAWSQSLLCRRMAARYAGEDATLAPPPSFAAHALRERAGREDARRKTARAYWDEKLARPGDRTDFYGHRPGGRTTRSTRQRLRLGRERTRALKDAATREARMLNPELSLFCTTAALLLAYLHRVGGGRRLVLGAPVHNRATPQAKETPGLFIEVFPLVVDIAADETFASLLRKVCAETMRTLAHAAPGVSAPQTNQAYDTLLNFVHARMPRFGDLRTRSDWVHSGHGDPMHKLRVQVHDFDGDADLTLDMDCNRGAFGDSTRELAATHLLRIVDAFLADPASSLTAAPLASPDEQAAQVDAFNRSATPPPGEDVIGMFLRSVHESPDAVAIETDGERLTYATLDRVSDRLATRLRALGLGPGRLLAIVSDRSSLAVTAMIAAWKAGGAYLPLDPQHPPGRLRDILEDVAASDCGPVVAVLSDRENASDFAGGAPVLRPDELARDLDGACDAQVVARATPATGALAYVIYTSGSTGRPKGVAIAHAAVANYVAWAAASYCGADKPAFALHSSLAVDLTVTSVWVPLACGGRILVYPDTAAQDLPILRVFREDRADVVKLTPAHLALINEMDGRAQRIRTLILGGEDLKADLVRAAGPRFPDDLVVYNEYGPTEATVGCMIHRFDPAQDHHASVPIGRPVANARIYVLDAAGQPAATGLTGEICIAGVGVAEGYLGRPDLTAERFLPDPFAPGRMYRSGDLGRWTPDGRLEYLGRGDQQVKIRGTRVEPAEIEAALLALPGIRHCVVDVYDARAAERARLCTRCGIPSNYPGVAFDAQDVCSMCIAFDHLRDKAESYFGTPADLERIAAEMRAGDGRYDCLVLLSGGKDSTYMLHRIVKLGLRVLAVTLDNGFVSDGAKDNVRRSVADLGIDHEYLTTPHMNEIFADSLERHSNVCHGCFKTIYTLSIQRAKALGVRHIVTGLSRGQIFETRLHDLFRNRIFETRAIEDAILAARKVYHRIDDAVARTLDVEIFSDETIFTEIRFVDFYRYCDVELSEIYSYLAERAPWIRPSDTGRSTNCLINDAGIYVHQLERGYHNYALPYSWDVRLGHKRRDDALYELNDEIDLARVRRALDTVGYREKPARTERRLVAWYVAERELPGARLRALLAERLPEEMIPVYFQRLEQLPLGTGGKVDRRALPEPGEGRRDTGVAYAAPQGEVEERLAELWAGELGVDRIGAHDDFFVLGGASLGAIRILARVADDFGVELPMSLLFERPTVAAVGSALEEILVAEIAALSDEEVERQLGRRGPA